MKLENLVYALFLMPLFAMTLWSGVVYTKGLYEWYIWYSAGAEIMVAEGPVVAVAPPGRKGPNQHRIVIKNKDGEKVMVYSLIPEELYRSLANSARRRSDFPYTALYTMGIYGNNEMFKFSARGRVLFENSVNYGSRPGQIIATIGGIFLWFSGAAIFLFMIIREFTIKEKD